MKTLNGKLIAPISIPPLNFYKVYSSEVGGQFQTEEFRVREGEVDWFLEHLDWSAQNNHSLAFPSSELT